MRIFVTGGSGFIGGHVIGHLISLGHEVANLDVKAPEDRSHPARFFPVDLLDGPEMTRAFRTFRPEGVVHLAAEAGLDERRGLAGYAPNIAGMRNLVAAIRASGDVRRSIFTSTQLVCRIGYQPAHATDYAPSTLYGESKVQTELIAREEDGGGAEWCLVRPTTIWGPGMNPHYRSFLRLLQRGWYFHVGSRPLLKSYGYVGNVAHQYARLLEASPESIQRKVFYLADYDPLSLRAWTDALAHELGGPKVRQYPEGLMRAAARFGDGLNRVGLRKFPFNSFRLNNILTEYVYDLSPTRSVCGPLPWGWRAGVRATADWFKAADRRSR